MTQLSRFLTILISICAILQTSAQEQKVHHLYCVGNLADIENKSIVSDALAIMLRDAPNESSVLFLGDFVDAFITNTNYESVKEDMEKIFLISEQFPEVGFYVLQGDRDWFRSQGGGWKNVRVLEEIIENLGYKNVKWVNDKGCPGPKLINLSDFAKVIAINSQWWNHPFRKPTPESIDCKISTKEGFYEELEDFLLENNHSHIAIASHFPTVSYGNFNGYYKFSDWLKPIPVLGSFLQSYRQNIGQSTDLVNPYFFELREKLMELNEISQSLLFLSGHEQNTQIIQKRENFHINAGLGHSNSFYKERKDLLYGSKEQSIVRVSFFKNGTSKATVFDLNTLKTSFEGKLLESPCNINTLKFVNHQFEPCLYGDYDNSPAKEEGIKMLAGSEKYKARGFKKMMLGAHYRASWTSKINVSPLPLDLHGGLDAYEMGGGRQTRSLKFIGGDGKQYVFRSIDKDPSKALSYILRKTAVARIVQDQTSTQHPYGAIVASELLDHTNILHAKPLVFYLPDDPALHIFREDFKGMLGMLEERPSGKVAKGNVFAGANDVVKTASMFRTKFKDLKNTIALDEYLQARMFDILVGDWGKHEDNWKWAAYKGKKNWFFRPIPRDRDHVFSRWDGVLPWFVDREWAKPSGENFGKKIKGLRSLVWQARHQDRFLTQEASRNDWIDAAKVLQGQLTEEVIDSSLAAFPKTIQQIDANEISEKLKARRGDLKKYAADMYEMLAKTPDIVGSDKGDYFDIRLHKNGDVNVKIYNNQSKKRLYFDRTFLTQETREIRLFGLGGKDHYFIHGQKNGRIKLRLIPGESNDTIQDLSEPVRKKSNVTVYTRRPSEVISEKSKFKFYKKDYQAAYDFGRTEFKFDTYFPLFYAFYSGDDGLGIKAGITFRNQKYGKPDFASSYKFAGGLTTLGNYNFDFTSRFRYVIKSWDLEFAASYRNHRVYNSFFGFGNNSIKDPALFDADYYQLRFNNGQASVSLIREFARQSSVNFNFGVEHLGRDMQQGNIIEDLGEIRGASEEMNFLFARQELDLDFRDDINLPYRGHRLQVQLINAQPLEKQFNYFGRIFAAIESFHSTLGTRPLTLGMKIGVSSSWGDAPLQYQSTLGLSQNLRGFRKRRFTGEDALFVNLDLRWELLAKSNFFLPIKFGLKAFYDQGHVTYKGENSRKWHKGYGFGFFIVPYAENMTLNLLLGFSEEESKLLQFSLGRVF